LRYIFKMYGINTNDWIEYSATKPSEFNESKMMSMIKDKIVEFQRAFIYDRRNISFFGRNFNVSKMDSLVTAVNTKTIVDEIKLIESKKGQNSARYKKLQEITNSKLYADSSIEKFAVSLEKYNIKDYIDLYSNNPEKLVKDIWNLDIQNMDYNLSKPLTPGYFGEVLSHSKEISGAIFMGFGLLFMIMSSLGIYTVKRKNEYSYNKMRVDELFKNNQNAVIRKNKWIRVSLGGLLVLSAIVLLIGILITSGVVAPAIFIL
ncbi:MAG: hypothetical protein HRT99_03960, partial [Mycoplasmatales bacterium]|nr:hypothetical protein [Mycoplasmatales bacterium]